MIKTPLVESLYPVQPSSPHSASPRRLPTFWLWTTRILWVAIFVMMVALNIAAVVAHIERNGSGIAGGASGLLATKGEQGWTLTVDPIGPGAQAGIATGDLLLAVDGEQIAPDARYPQVNRLLFGTIGDPLLVTVQGSDSTVREVTLTLVAEDRLTIWRRWRVPLAITNGFLPALEALLLAGYLLTSLLIFWRRTDDWLALYLTLTLVLITPQLSYTWYYLGLTAPYWADIFRVIIFVGVTLTLPNFFLLPNGNFVPRWAFVLTILWVIFCFVTEFFPTSQFSIYKLSGAAQFLTWLAWFTTGMVAQAYRFHYHATPTEQQQIKWIGFGLTIAVLVNLGWALAFEFFPILDVPSAAHWWMWLLGRSIYVVGMLSLPVAFGIAVFRYRLWDIDNLINRTLVYGALTAIIVGIYIVVVSVLDVIFTSNGQVLSQIIAIALDLIIFEPLRDRLQRGVDRLMFGESDDLAEVMTRMGQRLSAAAGSEAVLPTIVETMADSFKSPYVAISLPQGDAFAIAAESGTPTAAYFTWPLVYHREVVGHLILARAIDEPYKAHEWELVEHVSANVSAAVHDVMLERELARRNAVEKGTL